MNVTHMNIVYIDNECDTYEYSNECDTYEYSVYIVYIMKAVQY